MQKPALKANYEIKPYVTFGYALFVVALLGLGLFGWYHVQANVQQVYGTVEETNTKIRLARTMQTAILKRVVILHNAYVTNDPFIRDELRLRFIQLAGDYRKARKKLIALGLSDEEKHQDDKLRAAIKQSQALTEIAMNLVIDEAPPEVFLPAAARAETVQNKLIALLDELVELERQRQQIELDKSNRDFELFQTILFTSSLLVLLISTLIAINLGRVIIRRSRLAMELANKDNLTGLLNRLSFTHSLNLAIDEAKQEHLSHSLLFMDLDKFKPINDTCGHAAGDRLLKEIACKWGIRIRNDDQLARMGGDEFTLLLKRTSPEQARKIAQQLVAITEEIIFEHQGKTFPIGVSIGIAEINQETQSASAILEQADQACYAAKASDTESVVLAPQPSI
jgi:diguanylate cyclase (GGDEF)-like protein